MDGHSYEELLPVLASLRKKTTDRPMCIIADTVKGKGLDYIANIPLMHGYMPKGDDVRRAFESIETACCPIAHTGGKE